MKIYAAHRGNDVNDVLESLIDKDLWVRITLDGDTSCWIKVLGIRVMRIMTYYDCLVCYDRYLHSYINNKSTVRWLCKKDVLIDSEIQLSDPLEIVAEDELFENGANL